MFPTRFAITWVLTISVVVEVPVGIILHTGLYGTDQFLLLQLAVEGAMSPIGKGGHAGLHAAAAGPPGGRPPPRVLHHQQPSVRTPL